MKCFTFVILFCWTVLLSGQVYNGIIYVEENEIYNEKSKELYNKQLSTYGSVYGDIPYEESLITLKKYKICADTLILTYIKGEKSWTNYQLKNNMYIPSKGERMLKMKIKTAINEVKKFDYVRKEEMITGITTDVYSGTTPTKETIFTLYIDKKRQFSQNKYGYLFSDVFNENGLIFKKIMNYIPQNLLREAIIINITENDCPCSKDFDFSLISKTPNNLDIKKSNENNLNLKNSSIEEITLDDLLLKNGKDTTLIEEKHRQFLSIICQNALVENLNLDSIKGA
jgi:hypothetical protein